ncbi:hypothetical protein M440DRAFT_1389868 [Trichoderma longibrachiatum ATCC 18648]|uniref:Uncharacterized protein n=1 Tax=Trichoderma longibrachiatum ATCC 18648 TaxID=983965 RepID=A0A2T4C976_TRILO|nr:hypothetical protein M440DRAFT_1389868 [Trichoderma longibrachiatum ATCC 18648]
MDGIQVAWQASAKRSSRSLEKRREQHRHEGLGEPLDRHVKLRRGRERNNIVIERTEEVRKGIKYELWHEWWCGREEEKKRQWKVDASASGRDGSGGLRYLCLYLCQYRYLCSWGLSIHSQCCSTFVVLTGQRPEWGSRAVPPYLSYTRAEEAEQGRHQRVPRTGTWGHQGLEYSQQRVKGGGQIEDSTELNATRHGVQCIPMKHQSLTPSQQRSEATHNALCHPRQGARTGLLPTFRLPVLPLAARGTKDPRPEANTAE